MFNISRIVLEVNGLANISAILDSLEMDKKDLGEYPQDAVKKAVDDVREQLDLLNRYMVALTKAANQARAKNPYWHEVRDDKHRYPTNKG